jgi:SAM-dependent methyltransferase
VASRADTSHSAGSAGRAGGGIDGIDERPDALSCLICKGREHRVVFTELGIDILRCKRCGHVFSSYRADPHYAGYWGSEVAQGAHHYWSKARARMHRDFFERFVVGRSGRLLDMGCGLGFFVKAMAPYREWEAHGCEISPAAVRYAREQLGLANVVCSPLQDAPLPQGSFDIITMWDVLDHILHPDPLLRHCHALLNEGGRLFIRTPNVTTQLVRARLMRAMRGRERNTAYIQARDHPHQYAMRSIEKLLDRNGFGELAFIHLCPIETGNGWKGALVNAGKHVGYQVLRTLAVCSGGFLNFDNLFVVARKRSAAPSA